MLKGNAGQLRYLVSVCRPCHREIEFHGDKKLKPEAVRQEEARQRNIFRRLAHPAPAHRSNEPSLDEQFLAALDREP